MLVFLSPSCTVTSCALAAMQFVSKTRWAGLRYQLINHFRVGMAMMGGGHCGLYRIKKMLLPKTEENEKYWEEISWFKICTEWKNLDGPISTRIFSYICLSQIFDDFKVSQVPSECSNFKYHLKLPKIEKKGKLNVNFRNTESANITENLQIFLFKKYSNFWLNLIY